MVSKSELEASIAPLEGGEIARIVSIAFFALTVYEWMITLDEEIRYFWKGPWTSSRMLFLLNRYVPPIIMLLGLLCFFVPNPTEEFCRPAIQFSIVANIGSIAIIQAILVLRVWYLFSSNNIIRRGIVLAFALSILVSLTFAIVAAHNLVLLPPLNHVQAVNIVGCRAVRPENFWRLFFPSLILHTILYVLTAFRALQNRRMLQKAPMFKRLVRDGGFFYFVVFISVGFTAVGSFLTQYPRLNISIAFSNYLIATNSIAVSRVILSIHSLEARLGSDTGWLLNNVELDRVGWRKGSTEGEIIVERWTTEDDDDVESAHEAGRAATPMKMTRVGVYDDDRRW